MLDTMKDPALAPSSSDFNCNAQTSTEVFIALDAESREKFDNKVTSCRGCPVYRLISPFLFFSDLYRD